MEQLPAAALGRKRGRGDNERAFGRERDFEHRLEPYESAIHFAKIACAPPHLGRKSADLPAKALDSVGELDSARQSVPDFFRNTHLFGPARRAATSPRAGAAQRHDSLTDIALGFCDRPSGAFGRGA